jgi:hypothetical protein
VVHAPQNIFRPARQRPSAQFLFQQLVERHRNLPGLCEPILDGGGRPTLDKLTSPVAFSLHLLGISRPPSLRSGTEFALANDARDLRLHAFRLLH